MALLGLTVPHSHPLPPGKTTLIQALTGEAAMQPRDQPFATLDVTVHAGLLPSRLRILYVDTIGFLSQLPHSLIHAFSATLEDVAYSVGVKDPMVGACSHCGPLCVSGHPPRPGCDVDVVPRQFLSADCLSPGHAP